MRKTSRIVSILFSIIALCGCTHNNGDIGALFGTWKLTSVSIDGVTAGLISEDRYITWAFQNNIVYVELLSEHQTHIDTYGTWEWVEEGKTMRLNFTHIGGFPWGDVPFPGEIVFEVQVTELNKKHLKFVYVTDTGEKINYGFQKLD